MSTTKGTEKFEKTFKMPEPTIKDVEGLTFTENHTNMDMAQMLVCMEPYLEKATGKFGYAIARNVRKVKEACAEYLQTRQNLFEELGEEEKDEDGNPTGRIQIKIGTDAFKEFNRRLAEFGGIKHSVEIYKVSYNVLPKEMTAGDMLNLEWMLLDVSVEGGDE